MSAAPEVARAVPAPAAAGRPPAPRVRPAAPALHRRLAARLTGAWLPRAAWALGRTGRPGLAGLALLLASALFLLSTHLPVAREVRALRADLAAAQRQPRAPAADEAADPALAARALPARDEVPALLRRLFAEAGRAHLAIDTAKYEVSVARTGGVVRTQIAFPVTGPYPEIRAFIDAALTELPAVGLGQLVLERKSIADGNVEAQLRMTLYTRSAP